MARDATLALLGVAHHRWWWPCGESVTRDPPHVEDLPANVVDQDLRGAGNLAMAKDGRLQQPTDARASVVAGGDQQLGADTTRGPLERLLPTEH